MLLNTENEVMNYSYNIMNTVPVYEKLQYGCKLKKLSKGLNKKIRKLPVFTNNQNLNRNFYDEIVQQYYIGKSIQINNKAQLNNNFYENFTFYDLLRKNVGNTGKLIWEGNNHFELQKSMIKKTSKSIKRVKKFLKYSDVSGSFEDRIRSSRKMSDKNPQPLLKRKLPISELSKISADKDDASKNIIDNFEGKRNTKYTTRPYDFHTVSHIPITNKKNIKKLFKFEGIPSLNEKKYEVDLYERKYRLCNYSYKYLLIRSTCDDTIDKAGQYMNDCDPINKVFNKVLDTKIKKKLPTIEEFEEDESHKEECLSDNKEPEKIEIIECDEEPDDDDNLIDEKENTERQIPEELESQINSQSTFTRMIGMLREQGKLNAKRNNDKQKLVEEIDEVSQEMVVDEVSEEMVERKPQNTFTTKKNINQAKSFNLSQPNQIKAIGRKDDHSLYSNELEILDDKNHMSEFSYHRGKFAERQLQDCKSDNFKSPRGVVCTKEKNNMKSIMMDSDEIQEDKVQVNQKDQDAENRLEYLIDNYLITKGVDDIKKKRISEKVQKGSEKLKEVELDDIYNNDNDKAKRNHNLCTFRSSPAIDTSAEISVKSQAFKDIVETKKKLTYEKIIQIFFSLIKKISFDSKIKFEAVIRKQNRFPYKIGQLVVMITVTVIYGALTVVIFIEIFNQSFQFFESNYESQYSIIDFYHIEKIYFGSMVNTIAYNEGIYTANRLSTMNFNTYEDYIEYSNIKQKNSLTRANENAEEICMKYHEFICFTFMSSDTIYNYFNSQKYFGNSDSTYKVNSRPTYNLVNHSIYDVQLYNIPNSIIHQLEEPHTSIQNISTNTDQFFIRNNMYNMLNISYNHYMDTVSNLDRLHIVMLSEAHSEQLYKALYYLCPTYLLIIIINIYVFCIRSSFKHMYEKIYKADQSLLKNRYKQLKKLSIILQKLKNTTKYENINMNNVIKYIENTEIKKDDYKKYQSRFRNYIKKKQIGFFSFKVFNILIIVVFLSLIYSQAFQRIGSMYFLNIKDNVLKTFIHLDHQYTNHLNTYNHILIYSILGANELVLTNQTIKNYLPSTLIYLKENDYRFEELQKNIYMKDYLDKDFCKIFIYTNESWCDLDGGYARISLKSQFERTQSQLSYFQDKIIVDIDANVYSNKFQNDTDWIEWEFSFINVVLETYDNIKCKIYRRIIDEVFESQKKHFYYCFWICIVTVVFVHWVCLFIQQLEIYKLVYTGLFVFQMFSCDVVANDLNMRKQFVTFYRQNDNLFV